MENKKIILTSHGLNCNVGRQAIKRAFRECIGEKFGEFLVDKNIMLCTIKADGINDLLHDEAVMLGFKEENVVVWDENGLDKIRKGRDKYSFCYVGEGNPFKIMQMLKKTGADIVIKQSVKDGGFYIGASAGAMIATSSIEFANDFEKCPVKVDDYKGLDILPEKLGTTAIIPHYNKHEFMRWKKNTKQKVLDEYSYIDYITETGYKLF